MKRLVIPAGVFLALALTCMSLALGQQRRVAPARVAPAPVAPAPVPVDAPRAPVDAFDFLEVGNDYDFYDIKGIGIYRIIAKPKNNWVLVRENFNEGMAELQVINLNNITKVRIRQ